MGRVRRLRRAGRAARLSRRGGRGGRRAGGGARRGGRRRLGRALEAVPPAVPGRGPGLGAPSVDGAADRDRRRGRGSRPGLRHRLARDHPALSGAAAGARAEGSLADLGCGSGVLAIAAAKLGFGPVTAVDHDAAALEATRENARANGVVLGRGRAARPAPDAAAASADGGGQPDAPAAAPGGGPHGASARARSSSPVCSTTRRTRWRRRSRRCANAAAFRRSVGALCYLPIPRGRCPRSPGRVRHPSVVTERRSKLYRRGLLDTP